ncbi:Proteobacterial sortase system OmpA family protein [Caenorhabditis elegans]|uniref:Proteobacterial sortase system OmpA family protein n=1 Tax=Caenorhabditis elegans TaxID=6239 RepID=Q966J4_CAEEL|nr:Proteobacterial sortase system OmpA family protein [Caenorhabditis elegans]CCD67906.1 Proteobacterial sortase system OmpA family protein [Caenorhabditis elegans]|eukprot:NP_509150.1 Uncharacterized protein CELE_F41B4.3 [Caenorhabditis elegans]
MTDNYLRQVIDHAQNNQRLRGTMSGIFYQTAYAAAGAGAGGLMAGPLGAMFGTMAGAVYGYANSDDYSSVFGIIQNLEDEEKDILTSTIRNHVGGLTFAEFVNWFKDLNHQATFMQLLMAYMAANQKSAGTSRR